MAGEIVESSLAVVENALGQCFAQLNWIPSQSVLKYVLHEIKGLKLSYALESGISGVEVSVQDDSLILTYKLEIAKDGELDFNREETLAQVETKLMLLFLEKVKRIYSYMIDPLQEETK